MREIVLSFVLEAMTEALPDGIVAHRNGESIDICIEGESVVNTIDLVSHSVLRPSHDALFLQT